MSSASDFVIENGVLKKYVGPGGDVTIPEGVTSIGKEAFYGCSSLKSVSIPAGVTSIGYSAFYGCTCLKSIAMPDGVTEIGDWVFKDCIKLTSITLPGSLKSIGGEAFRGCVDLTDISLPEGLISIGYGAFRDCKKLTSVSVRGLKDAETADGNRQDEGLLPRSMEYIGDSAFSNVPWYRKAPEVADGCHYFGRFLVRSEQDIEHAEVRDGTVMICDYAFRSREGLVSAHIPDSVKYIGEMAFCGCRALKEIRLPPSVSSIGASCFSACPSLKYFEAASPELEICENSFGSNSSSSLYYPEYAYIPTKIESSGEVRKLHCFCYLTSRERFSPELQSFNDAVVKKNKNNLLELVIEKKNAAALRNIAPFVCTADNIDSLIERVQRLGSVEMAAALLDWKEKNVSAEDREKQLMKELRKDPMSAGELKKVWSIRKLADGTLGLAAYKGTALDVIVPAAIGKTKVTVICEKACYAFRSWLSKTPTDNQVAIRKQIRSVTIQDGVKKIEYEAFYDCEKLEHIHIPRSVKIIGFGVFTGCPNLTIHAPAGSCAEQYAKEHNIPFVAED